jgi:hypothetical protein
VLTPVAYFNVCLPNTAALKAAMSLVGPQKALMEIPGPVTDLFLAATRRASQRLGFETANSKPK